MSKHPLQGNTKLMQACKLCHNKSISRGCRAHGSTYHRDSTSNTSVRLDNLGGCVAQNNPIIQHIGGVGFKGGCQAAENGAPDGGVVPQEAVAQAREGEGDGGLGISLRELEVGTLEV